MEAISRPTLRRWRMTPVNDLLRGRVSGRLDYEWRIESSGLPVVVRSLVMTVVSRTRLWRTERTAVAGELVAHFADGLSAGRTEAELIRSFGDPAVAAKLTSRAKRRARSLPAKAHMWLARGSIAFWLLYGISLARFALGRPTISVDYIAVLNRPTLATPESDRAWPLWRQAMIAAAEPGQTGSSFAQISSKSNDDYEAGVTDWVRRHPDTIAGFRAAAVKPTLGFVIGPGGSLDDPAMFGPSTSWGRLSLTETLRLPHLNMLRHAANLIDADARLAVEADDADRFEGDIRALVGLFRQLVTADHILVTQLTARGPWDAAIERCGRTLVAKPPLLSDAAWVRLAHLLSGPKSAADLIDCSNERMFVEDAVQRIYTDDGHGDGHATLTGIRDFGHEAELDKHYGEQLMSFETAASIPGGTAGRAEILAAHQQMWTMARALLDRPIGQTDWKPVEQLLTNIKSSPVQAIRYFPLNWLSPTIRRAYLVSDAAIGERDGLFAGIALELYRRHAGAYPKTLDEMVPQYLPAVPIDRITGGPVKYRLIDGKPVVYSVGVDRVDDGGRRSDRESRKRPYDPVDPIKGDWVLYPPPPKDN